MNKILILFFFVSIINMYTANPVKNHPSFLHDKFVHIKAKRSIGDAENEYLSFMKGLDWNYLENSNLTLSVGGTNYKLSQELLKNMEDYHKSK